MHRRHHLVESGDGWLLSLWQASHPKHLRPDWSPIVLIPGYGMNTSIMRYASDGLSLERTLAEAGFEVWEVDLRGQGDSRKVGGESNFGMRDLAVTDLGAALRCIEKHRFSQRETLHAVGCSLGASILYYHLASRLKAPAPFSSLTSIAGPLRWVSVHPLVRALFASPRLAGIVPIRGSRRVAQLALPWLLRMPRLLSLYMNAEHIQTEDVNSFVQSVEDPSRKLNGEIARWIASGDLEWAGGSVSRALEGFEAPFLAFAGNADGIVPPATVRSAFESVGSSVREFRLLGSRLHQLAHADLFISRYASSLVFRPLARWLQGLESTGSRQGEARVL